MKKELTTGSGAEMIDLAETPKEEGLIGVWKRVNLKGVGDNDGFYEYSPASQTPKENRSKYWDTMVNILDNCFEKGKCQERGRALVFLSYIEMMLQGFEFNEDGEPKKQ